MTFASQYKPNQIPFIHVTKYPLADLALEPWPYSRP